MKELNDKFSLLNFELIGKDIKIDFTKHLTKKDKELFRNIKLQKYNHISLNRFYEIFDLTTKDEAVKFLNNLMSKCITINSKEINYFTCITILQSFYINNGIIYLVFSDEITNSFKKGSFFDKLGLRNILFFEEKFSYRLYQYIYNSKEKSIYIPMELLREILEIGESYKRFYDIEKNLLQPIFEDIRKNGNLNLTYEKIKNGEHKSAKILGIEIDGKIENSESKIENTAQTIDMLMRKLGRNIKNFSEVYSILVKNIAEFGEEYVREKVEEVLKNFSENYEEHLKQAFISKEIVLEKPDFVIEKNLKNLFELHSTIVSFINKQNFTQLSTYMFLVKLYSLKDKDSVVLNDKNLSIKVTYNKNDVSRIEFFIKNK